MQQRRESAPLLLSIAIHVGLAFAILNAAFHYDFAGLEVVRTVRTAPEKLTYISVAPAGGATGDRDSTPAARATQPSRGLIAPVRVPSAIAAPAPATTSTPDGVVGGRGQGSTINVTTGIVPGDRDPRLANDSHEFYPAPKTHAERVDSAVRASIYAYNDSVAKARALAGKAPGDWTYDGKNGQKWGIDGNKIYLGKFAIPSAVLAALPLRIQGNQSEAIADRLVGSRRADLLLHADAAFHDDEFKTAVKRIRERKDKERQEKRQSADADKALRSNPDIVP